MSWRGPARLAATLSNTAMVLYIYVAHLLELEWERFGNLRGLAPGESPRLWDYLRIQELDTAFEHLRLLTFSDAMLRYLDVYLIVGTPVAVMLYVLERDRIQWLEALAQARLPAREAGRASWWLHFYRRVVSVMLLLILAIAPFHLGLPRLHYSVTACALSAGMLSIYAYLTALQILDVESCEGEDELAIWTRRARCWVRPALKLVISLHVLAFAAAVLKAESLGDDRSALAFGILETLVVLGYQLYQGVFIVDDMMVGRPVPAVSAPMKSEVKKVGDVKDKAIFQPEHLLQERLMGS